MNDEQFLRVDWPESQKYMDYEGFEENAIPTDEPGEYLIEFNWMTDVDNGKIKMMD